MESEKVKEIKKIAMSCVEKNKPHCEDCTKKDEDDVVLTCRSLLKDCLTLINELGSENERLSSRYRNLEINYNDTWEHYREYEVENQKLKDRIALLEKDNKLLRNAKVVYENVDYCYEDLKKAEKRIAELEKEKKEQLKQFAERLKEKIKSLDKWYSEEIIDMQYNGITATDIDETLKEFIK